MAVFSDDYVIEKLNAEDFTGLADPLSKEDVIMAWRGITAWMLCGVQDYA
jgi:hypothetical protein